MAASFGQMASQMRRPRPVRSRGPRATESRRWGSALGLRRRRLLGVKYEHGSAPPRAVAPSPWPRSRRPRPSRSGAGRAGDVEGRGDPAGPGDITTMRSPSRAASRTLWVTNTTVGRGPARARRARRGGVAGHRVEGAERLVHQQQLRVLGEGPGERAALAHAARQLVRALAREAVEVHGGEELVDRARRSAFGTLARRIGSSTLARRSATGTAPTPGTSAPARRRRRRVPRSAGRARRSG